MLLESGTLLVEGLAISFSGLFLVGAFKLSYFTLLSDGTVCACLCASAEQHI